MSKKTRKPDPVHVVFRQGPEWNEPVRAFLDETQAQECADWYNANRPKGEVTTGNAIEKLSTYVVVDITLETGKPAEPEVPQGDPLQGLRDAWEFYVLARNDPEALDTGARRDAHDWIYSEVAKLLGVPKT